MKKKEIKKLKEGIKKVSNLEDMRKICQEFNDLIGGPHNFKILDEDYVIASFNQIKEVILCLK